MLLLIGAGAIFAENYTIKMLNTASININGKQMHVGDSFDENAKINWASDKQAMKVLSDANVLYVITPKLFKQKEVRSFSDFIAATKAATVRASDGFLVSLDDHRSVFSGDFILLDSISIKVGWRIDDNSYFIAEGNGVSFRIPHSNGCLIFTPNLFDGVASKDDSVKLTIRYVENEYNDTTLVTNTMNIIQVPLDIE